MYIENRGSMSLLHFIHKINNVLQALRLRRKELKKLRRQGYNTDNLHKKLIPYLRQLYITCEKLMLINHTGLCAVYRITENIDIVRTINKYLEDDTFDKYWKNPNELFIQLLREYQKIVEYYIKNNKYFIESNKITPFSNEVLHFLYGRQDEISYHKCFCEYVCRVDELEDTWNNCEYCDLCNYPSSESVYRINILGHKKVEKFEITYHPFPYLNLNNLSPYMRKIYQSIIDENIRKKSIGWRTVCSFPDDIKIFPKTKVEEYWNKWCYRVSMSYEEEYYL